MVKGFYSAASGVFSRQKNFNMISNNLANASTVGYKSQNTVESSFGEHLVSKLNAGPYTNIGESSFITVNIGEYTDFEQGAFEETSRDLDMAISGEGYFLIDSESNGRVLTRNGQFEMDQDGYLVLPGVGRVLNREEASIELNDEFSADILFVAVPDEGSTMTVVGEGLYRCDGGIVAGEEDTYSVLQRTIEKSNINIAKEMSQMIAGQNHFQSCIQILKMYDKINEITVNQIGRIG